MKTTAMFMVIVAHCALFFSGNEFWLIRADQESEILRWISNFVVLAVIPIFTFATGFLLKLSLQKNKDGIVGLIKKKAVRLLIPYFIYGTLWLVPTYTLFNIPNFGRDKGASLIDGYKAMALGKFSDVAWYLLMMFWVTVIWILLNRLLKKENLIYGAIASVVLYFAAHFLLAQLIITKYLKLIFILLCFLLEQPFSTYQMQCQTKLVKKMEKTAVYSWLCKNSLYIYLLQAPGAYIVFKIVYPLIGSNAFLCFLVQFIATTLFDVILTLIFVFIKKRLLFVHIGDGRG